MQTNSFKFQLNFYSIIQQYNTEVEVLPYNETGNNYCGKKFVNETKLLKYLNLIIMVYPETMLSGFE